MHMLRNHLRANVVGYLALFVALSGTAVALPATGTVFSDDIVNGQVRTKDISNTNGVRSADVRDDTRNGGGLARVDLAQDSVGRSEIGDIGVGIDELAPDSVDRSEIVTNGVGSSEIADNSVGKDEITTDGVSTLEIADSSVGSSDIAENGVGSLEIAADAVGGVRDRRQQRRQLDARRELRRRVGARVQRRRQGRDR